MSETPQLTSTGHHRVEEAAAAYQAMAEDTRLAEDFAQEKQAGIEARTNSQEVQLLNDIAQIEIYGTNGRTDGFIDPESGQPLTEPIPGKLEEIRQNPRYGTKAEDRENAADQYQRDVESLVGEGYELAQAKLIMDKRDERDERVLKEYDLHDKVMMQYRKNGMSEQEAAEAYEKRGLSKRMINWAQEDADLKKLVREEGTFTADEYDRVINEGDDQNQNTDPDPTPNPDPNTDPNNDPTQIDPSPEDMAAIQELNTQVDEMRKEYLQRNAGRGSRAFRFGKQYSEKAVAEAREQYEAKKDELLQRQLDVARTAGVSEEELENAAGAAAVMEAEKLANGAFQARLAATGKWEKQEVYDPSNGDRSMKMVYLGRPLFKDRWIAAFKKRWGTRPADVKGFSKENIKLKAKRAALLASIPAGAAGIVAAGSIAPPLVLGPGAAYFANLLAGHMLNKKPGEPTFRDEARVHKSRDAVRNEMFESLRDAQPDRNFEESPFAGLGAELHYAVGNLALAGTQAAEMDKTVANLLDEQTEGYLSLNRKKKVAQIGATAAAAAFAAGPVSTEVGRHLF